MKKGFLTHCNNDYNDYVNNDIHDINNDYHDDDGNNNIGMHNDNVNDDNQYNYHNKYERGYL